MAAIVQFNRRAFTITNQTGYGPARTRCQRPLVRGIDYRTIDRPAERRLPPHRSRASNLPARSAATMNLIARLIYTPNY